MIDGGFEMINHFVGVVEWVKPGYGILPDRQAYFKRFTRGLAECAYNMGNIAFVVQGDRASHSVLKFTTYWEGNEFRSGPANYHELLERIDNWRAWAQRKH